MFYNDPSQTIIVAGSGRSGTTWLGNVIAADPLFRIIFEPFDSRRVAQFAGLPLRPYFRPDQQNVAWEGVFRQVLLGKIRSPWIDRESPRHGWAPKKLVKEIRANLMLSWLGRTFHCPIAYIIRHPCAVVLSRLRNKWEAHLNVFLDQPQLMQDHLAPYEDVICSATSAAQKHAVMWCIENLVPLQQLSQEKWIFCTYERLYLQPETEMSRVVEGLGLAYNRRRKRAVSEISRMTTASSAILNNRNVLSEWQRVLLKDEIRDILTTVERFGIDLYDGDILPKVELIQEAHRWRS